MHNSPGNQGSRRRYINTPDSFGPVQLLKMIVFEKIGIFEGEVTRRSVDPKELVKFFLCRNDDLFHNLSQIREMELNFPWNVALEIMNLITNSRAQRVVKVRWELIDFTNRRATPSVNPEPCTFSISYQKTRVINYKYSCFTLLHN